MSVTKYTDDDLKLCIKLLTGVDAEKVLGKNWLLVANSKALLILEQLAENLFYVLKTRCNSGVCADGTGKIVNLEDVIHYLKTGFFD